MPLELKYFIVGFIVGLLLPYIIGIFDLINNMFANFQTLHANKIQKKIDEINPQYEINEPVIGFQVGDNDTSMEYEEE
jgi:hypothetical protein